MTMNGQEEKPISELAATPSVSALLQAEQKEINDWARKALEIYFNWYCVFLTINGAGLAWSFAPEKGNGKPPYFWIAASIFAFWNALGVVVSFFLHRYVADADKRVTKIYEKLLGDSSKLMPRSAIPVEVAHRAIYLDCAAMCSLVFAWGFLAWLGR
jgi:hypothetical protein